MSKTIQFLLYAIPVVLIFVWYMRKHFQRESTSLSTLHTAKADGLIEPPTLHPEINRTKCIGCTNCVAACPEQGSHQVLGMIRKKAHLVGPTNCIGHGACKTVCPADAITLVFGTARRGVDIPRVEPDFQTNVPGIYIAGELGGMGLIKNAIEQGRQAMQSIVKLVETPHKNELDVVIIGVGPSGFAASLGAMEAGLKFATVEQDSLGGTVSHFPRGKLVMTQPANLPIVGKMQFTETSKEKLLEFWQGVESKTQLKVNYHERVTDIAASSGGGGFEVTTTAASYSCRAVLLTIGRRGTPRQLGVPGEEQTKVTYRLIDPSEHKGRHVLVVGGGDSALEAAHTIAEEPGTTVTLSYRSEAFSRAKQANRQKVEKLAGEGRLRVLMSSNVREIGADAVVIDYQDKSYRLPNDAVIICAGGILPTAFLKSIGIDVETKFGTA